MFSIYFSIFAVFYTILVQLDYLRDYFFYKCKAKRKNFNIPSKQNEEDTRQAHDDRDKQEYLISIQNLEKTFGDE